MKNEKTRILCEGGLIVALTTVLSFVKIWQAPYGGSVTLLCMAPLILFSLRRGVKNALCAGFAAAVIQLMFGLQNVAWVPTAWGIALCILLDYLLAYTLLGLAGLFRTLPPVRAALLGTLLVCLLRFACHLVSGAVIWYALDLQWYAEDAGHIVNRYGPWLFSLIYNGSFMLPETLETLVGVPLLYKALGEKR